MAAEVSTDRWVERFDALVADLDGLEFVEVQRRCVAGRAKLDAVEARLLAAEIPADGDQSRARRLASDGGRRSKRAARAAAARADAVAENPSLADDLAAGRLGTEQLDNIADAMSVDRAAASDAEFVDAIKARSADQGRRLVRERNNAAKSAEGDHDRQRRLRHARCFTDKAAGLSTILMAGDDATVAEMWNLVRLRERQLRVDDGGRDVPVEQHRRTLDQRLFDAMVDLLSDPASTTGSRPATVLTVPVDGRSASIAGGGPVSDDYVATVLQRSDLSVLLVDRLTTRPLWMGRVARSASLAQFTTLVIRDHGCVLCGAAWIGCEVHHLLPWHATGQGRTDIDNLALLCVDCHHHLHADKLTLEHLDDGRWKTRPALDHEISRTWRPTRRGPPHDPG